MNLKEKLTAGLFNYQGNRNRVDEKGRLLITIESLTQSFPQMRDIRLILIDNESTDGSLQLLIDHPIGEKYVLPRLTIEEGWYPTTRNNFENLRRTLEMTSTPYYWNIENDSFFYNEGGTFIRKAIEVLEGNEDISIVHLRRWSPMDCRDKPGAPQNHCRVSEVRRCSDFYFYVLEKHQDEHVWVDVGEGLPEDFVPSEGRGFVDLYAGNDPRCIRKRGSGWQRLMPDHYNTYTTHGYVVRTQDFRDLIAKHNPTGELETSIAFKKDYRASRLDEDAFLCFGWNTRVSPDQEEIKRMFEWAKKHNYSSVLDYGSINGQYVDSSKPREVREKFFQDKIVY